MISHPAAPAPALARQTREQKIGASRRILDSWCQQQVEVPPVAQLKTAVAQPLPIPLPFPIGADTLDVPAQDVMEKTDDGTLLPELELIRGAILAGRMYGDNEDSVHGLVDLLILRPVSLIGNGSNCPFAMQRNGVDSTGATISNLRPDVMVWLPSNVLAFKGED